jgi:putative transposase
MHETYIKVKGQWTYLYRAIDKYINTVDFMLSEHRDEVAATAFFKQAIDHNGLPSKVVIDHRFIKKITKSMMGFKIFHSASARLAGIDMAHMISKGQFANNQLPVHQQFIALAV